MVKISYTFSYDCTWRYTPIVELNIVDGITLVLLRKCAKENNNTKGLYKKLKIAKLQRSVVCISSSQNVSHMFKRILNLYFDYSVINKNVTFSRNCPKLHIRVFGKKEADPFGLQINS